MPRVPSKAMRNFSRLPAGDLLPRKPGRHVLISRTAPLHDVPAFRPASPQISNYQGEGGKRGELTQQARGNHHAVARRDWQEMPYIQTRRDVLDAHEKAIF